MFNLFKKKKELSIYAPVNGEIVPLNNVPDPVFSEGLMGEGIAIKPTDGHFKSPIDGEVILIAQTKHAIGLKAKDGTELLIHIGLDTVELNGQGFEPHVQVGDHLSLGQPIIDVDLSYIQNQSKPIYTPIIITNDPNHKKMMNLTEEKTATVTNTVLMTLN